MIMDDDQLAIALCSLGYPGFAHLEPNGPQDPAVVLLDAIDRDELDPLVRAALPWIPRKYSDLSWEQLIARARRRKRQNRLGFIVALAAHSSAYLDVHQKLTAVAERIAEIRSEEWDTLCSESMTKAERSSVHSQCFPIAQRWHIESDLEHVIHPSPRVGESFEEYVDIEYQIAPPREVCGHLRLRPGSLVRFTLTEEGVLMTSESFVRPEDV